jgi:FKBP-type peptidyl-prolyl cis-trans isomerase 2
MEPSLYDGQYLIASKVSYWIHPPERGDIVVLDPPNQQSEVPYIKRLIGLPGDVIEVPIDCNKLFGPRDESLVVTDLIENVPEEYRELGTSILMENDEGKTKTFIVTRVDDKTVTIDGNNPLCGREVIFKLSILTVRDATDEEVEIGGPVGANPDISDIVGEQRVKPI